MDLRIKFYKRGEVTPTFIDVPNDVVEIQVPATENTRALRINVNSDVVMVHTDGDLVAQYNFRDDLLEAEQEHDFTAD